MLLVSSMMLGIPLLGHPGLTMFSVLADLLSRAQLALATSNYVELSTYLVQHRKSPVRRSLWARSSAAFHNLGGNMSTKHNQFTGVLYGVGIAWGVISFVIGVISSFTLNSVHIVESLTVLIS